MYICRDKLIIAKNIVNTIIRILILLLAASVTTLPAEARKKPKSNPGDSSVELTEPDAMAPKAFKDKVHVRQSEISRHQGTVNDKFTEGIDVSHYQYEINWKTLVANHQISYAYIKATEGSGNVDEYYAYNIREAHNAGLSVGAYHFYRPNVDWEAQFENLVNVVQAKDQDLVPMIDIEDRGGVGLDKFINDLKSFIKKVTKHYGKKPILYSGQNFYNKYLSGTFKDYVWMIAKYNEAEEPYLSDGKKCEMWQYSSKGRFSGIRGNVDKSRILNGFKLKSIAM